MNVLDACDWCLKRSLTKPGYKIQKAVYEATVSKNSAMYAGETLKLCRSHRNNLALKFTKIEPLVKK